MELPGRKESTNSRPPPTNHRNSKSGIMILTKKKVKEPQASEICRSLGYSNWVCADPIGFVGGVWILWNEVDVHLTPITMTPHAIHATMEVRNSPNTWLISATYAPPILRIVIFLGKP